MKRYSAERKEAILRRMMAPENKPVSELAKENGIAEQTLYTWRRNLQSQGVGHSEAARPWLSAPSIKVVKLDEILTAVDLPDGFRCKKYGTVNKKSKEPVDGFICARHGRLLLYLTLKSYT